jgi:hypothetical protein
MQSREFRLSRPVYEALPWLYLTCGLLALVASYFRESGAFSAFLSILGLAGVLGGIVVLLRRRDFRQLSNQYTRADSSEISGRDD